MSDNVETFVAIDGKLIDSAKAPKDRTFRNAWSLDAKDNIIIDMDLARKIQLTAIRNERKPLLEKLDVDYQRADEEGNIELKKEIAEKKKILRNVTDDSRILAANTPEKLEKLDLEALIK